MSMSKLFQPIKLVDLTLSHRIILAPLTRFRADANHIPHVPLVKEYYSQRGSEPGTLLIAEVTLIHPRAGGWAHTPGIWSDAQVAAWKEVSFSTIQCENLSGLLERRFILDCERGTRKGIVHITYNYGLPVEWPHQTNFVEEIKEYAQYYAQAASNAVDKAGFDGVELHGANGYLIEQFLKESSNRRTDDYGGSSENRARFALEMVDAVVKAAGPKKTGIRLSPWNTFQETGDKDPIPAYSYLAKELKKAHPTLAFIHLVEPRVDGVTDVDPRNHNNDFIREIWTQGSEGTQTGYGQRLISAGGYDLESGAEFADTKGDLVAYGRWFISNPHLPYRLRHNISLTLYDRSTFYLRGSLEPRGYTDYPFAQREDSHTAVTRAA
ncbi:hypothetical protein AAF712_011134 [Marasmius tenuissimus]|uniref:NADH:flavin oxidoreductase/NADH oxidase N-terminal domain-containing protein n=1 Tax=Marasmius tenuissimus TaxID=585030 RepID=A0ABR2ZLY0_9AGAR